MKAKRHEKSINRSGENQELPELYASKVARTVLRGERGGNAPALPDSTREVLYL